MRRRKATYNVYDDPRYAEGVALRNEIYNSIADRQRAYREVMEPFHKAQSAPVLTPRGTAILGKEFLPNIDESGNVVPTEPEEEQGFFSLATDKIGRFLFGDYDNAAERWKEASVEDSWRLFHKKRIQSELTSAQRKLIESNEDLADLDLADEYANLLDEYDKFLNGGVEGSNERFNYVSNRIKEILELIKTSGKNSDILRDLFFNVSKSNFGQDYLAAIHNLGHTNASWYNPLLVFDIVPNSVNYIADLANAGIDALKGKSYNYVMNRAIKNAGTNNRDYDFLFNSYRDEESGINNTTELRKRVKDLRKYYQKDNDTKKAEVLDLTNTFVYGNWLFDPTKINPRFEQLQNSNNQGLIGGLVDPTQWAYSFPEMGTSYADWTTFVSLMATDKGAQLLTKRLLPWAAKKTGYGAAAMYATEAIESLLPAAQIAMTSHMRDVETGSEAVDAYSNRVATMMYKDRNIDSAKVLQSINEGLSEVGIDPNSLDYMSKLQLGLALNIPTGDKGFETAKKDAKKGLNKLINENNTLAVKDYLEALPFMDYSRSILRQLGRPISKSVYALAGIEETPAFLAAQRYGDTMFSKAIDRTASILSRSTAGALKAKHRIQYLLNKGKRLIPTGVIEGIEEGQQHLLQQRYGRGEYDMYDQNQTMFDMTSMFNDVDLAAEAVLAYNGLLFGDPNNGDALLVRAMNIGATTGVLFGTAHVLTNFVPWSTSEDNIKNLIYQMKNDNVIKHLIGENYGKYQDDEHVALFYDAMKKHGVTAERLSKSLQDLKGVKGELVTDDYIDQDIRLLNATDFMIKNKSLEKIAKALNIDTNSKTHRDIVQDAVRKYIDFQDAVNESGRALYKKEGLRNAVLRGYENGDIYEPIKDKIREENPEAYKEMTKEKEEALDALAKQRGQNTAKFFKRLEKEFKDQEEEVKKLRKSPQYKLFVLENAKNQASGNARMQETLDILNNLREDVNFRKKYYFGTQEENQYIDEQQKSIDEIEQQLVDEQIENDYILDKDRYVETAINDAIDLISQDVRNDILAQMDIQQQRLDLISAYTGKDIEDTTLRQMYKLIKQDSVDKGLKKLKLSKQRIDEMKSMFDDYEDVHRILKNSIINESLINTLRPGYSAFMYGTLNPLDLFTTVSKPSWKYLSKDQKDAYLEKKRQETGKDYTPQGIASVYETERLKENKWLLDKKNELEKQIADYLKLPEQERNSEKFTEEQTKLFEATAEAYIAKSLADKLERRRVAHRDFLRSQPLTGHAIEAAQNGNEDAQQVVEGAIEREERESGQIQEPQPSPAEQPPVQPTPPVENGQQGQTPQPSTNPDESHNPPLVNPTENPSEKPKEKENKEDEEPTLDSGESDPSTLDMESEPGSILDPSEDSGVLDLNEFDTYAGEDDGFLPSDPSTLDIDQFNIDFVLDESFYPTELLEEQNEEEESKHGDGRSQTFFYLPESDTTIVLTVDRNSLNFGKGKLLRTGKELALKLETPGWFQQSSVRKYCIVTGSSGSLGNYDHLSVHMIIEDGNDLYCVSQKKPNNDEKNTLINKYGKTEAEADAILDRLRANRNAIIKYYLKLTGGKLVTDITEDLKLVVPKSIRMSSGTIRNVRVNGVPAYRTIAGEEAGFGIPSDMVELDKLLHDSSKENRPLFGYGKGAFAPNPNHIENLDLNNQNSQTTDIADKGGRAGKIYLIVTAPNGQRRAIQLHEQTFDRQFSRVGGSPRVIKRGLHSENPRIDNLTDDDVYLALSEDGKINSIAEFEPSLAEIILYLACGKISQTEIPLDVQRSLLQFITRFGYKIFPSNKEAGIDFYTKKEFYITDDGKSLVLSQPTKLTKEGVPYSYQNVSFDLESLFTEENKALRRKAVYLISQNLHWNTDKAYMNTKLNDRSSKSLNFNALMTFLQRKFEQSQRSGNTSGIIKILGNRDFLFDINQLFYIENGQVHAADATLFSWMVTNGKLETDVDKRTFYAPFIYMDAKELHEPTNQEIANAEVNKGKTSNEGNVGPEEDLSSFIGSGINVDTDTKAATRTLILDKLEPQKPYAKNKEYYKQRTIKLLKRISETSGMPLLNVEALVDDAIMYAIFKEHQIPKITKYANGNVEFWLDPDGSGPHEERKTGGKLNEEKTRKWLEETLGLSGKNVAVVNGLIRSVSNGPLAYGLMNASVDSLANATGYIMLSRQAGRGIGYHEAWHYVSLLLFSPQERIRLYEYYKSLHPELKNHPYKDVEEALANEFRANVEMYNERNIGNLLKRAFNVVKDFMFASRKQEPLRVLFDNIRNGKYKGIPINEASAKEFFKMYPGGVNAQYSVDGYTDEELNRVPSIVSDTEFFQVARTLADLYLDCVTFDNIKDLNKEYLTEKTYSVQQRLRALINKSNEHQKAIINDVLNNIDLFGKIISDTFEQFGISFDFAKKTDENKVQDTVSAEDPTLKEDGPDSGSKRDFQYDIERFSVSHKDNVAYKAKLYLSKLHDRVYGELDPNTGERKIVTRGDKILPVDPYLSYSEAYTKVISELNDIDSFAEKDQNDKYLSSSLIGRLERLSKVDAVFKELYDKLRNLDDINIQNAILSSLKTHKTRPTYYQLTMQDDQVSEDDIELTTSLVMDLSQETGVDLTTAVADREKKWVLVNDNNFRARKSITRKWGNFAVSSGMTEVNQNRQMVISKTYTQNLKTMYRALTATVKKDNYDYNTAINDFLKILNAAGIQADAQTIERLLYKNSGQSLDLNDEEAKKAELKAMLLTENKTGTFANMFLTYLPGKAGIAEIVYRRRSGGVIRQPLSNIYSALSNGILGDLAEAYNDIHPSSSEFMMTAPDGSKVYPVNLNNFMSDTTRQLVDNVRRKASQMMESQYAKHSVVLQLADKLSRKPILNKEEVLQLNYLIGLRDDDKKEGQDYFGITPLEDYLIKMRMMFIDNMLISPTMADKKSYFALSSSGLSMIHDKVLYPGMTPVLPEGRITYFSQEVATLFANYFLDELNSLEEYYSVENIGDLMEHPDKLIENYHGTIDKETGRMMFNGNGGLFRYFYNLDVFGDNSGLNLNQRLEYEYHRQKIDENYRIVPGEDGFEYIRAFIQRIKNTVLTTFTAKDRAGNDLIVYMPSDTLLKTIDRDFLLKNTYEELRKLSEEGPYQMFKEQNGWYVPTKLPQDLLRKLADIFGDNYLPYGVEPQKDIKYAFALIANNFANSAMSIIEFEKVFSGDPAFYKWKPISNPEHKYTEIEYKGRTISIRNLGDMHADKIKRLGAQLSPGNNLRIDYNLDRLKESQDDAIMSLYSRRYTNLNMSDMNLKSLYLDALKEVYTKQGIVDYIESRGIENVKFAKDYFDKEVAKNEKYSEKQFYDEIFSNNYTYKQLYDAAEKEVKDAIDKYAKMSYSMYEKINVADAQVIIRPALYRKIRIALGDWSDDMEEAYDILEKDDSWMSDPKKAKIVSKLQLYPLKMSYFAHNPIRQSKNSTINKPLYNKMAIFPMFKYMTASEIGGKIYERMNRKGSELDMITFESAVKVGLNQKRFSPYKNKETDSSAFNFDEFDKDSNFSISIDDQIIPHDGENLLNVEIQDLEGLRLQLNTEAHDATDRNIGTQMSKLAFSNLRDDYSYGKNKDFMSPRNGAEIKRSIAASISALTQKGIENIEKSLFSQEGVPDQVKIRRKMIAIARSNNQGSSFESILQNGGKVASLMSRVLFENAITSIVYNDVVSINTKGGTAIQQSMFGFGSFGKDHVKTQGVNGGFNNYNDGKELQWNKEDGSMEVLLSENFFKAVVPKIYWDQGYTTRRQWLINHDIINGTKKNISFAAEDGTLIEDTVEKEGVSAKPTPFGIGYRIPTQGMSSIFAYAVADILPEQSGDLIIVPREFTKQTGADFDVDKLFLANLSYKDGVLEKLDKRVFDYTEDELKDISAGAITNQLLYDYMQVVSDLKNYSDARSSIDTIVEKINNNILPVVRESQKEYSYGGYCLLPSFQSDRKMEFSVGKDGIGPYALNVTNLAITQAVHLSMFFGDNEFNLGDLDQIKGQDGEKISSWLSAMVSAHVDVAKDPYIFALNLNKATYNMSNFLLRAGKGEKVFFFLCQPIIKKYASQIVNSGGLYGNNYDGNQHNKLFLAGRKKDIYKNLLKSVIDNFEAALSSHYGEKLTKKESEEYLAWRKWFNYATQEKEIDDINIKKQLWGSVFDEEVSDDVKNDPTSLYNLKRNMDMKSCISSKDDLYSIFMQIVSLRAFDRLEKYADAMSELVTDSQVDTKKAGNNIISQIIFKNRYEAFKLGGTHKGITWYINDNINQDYDKIVDQILKSGKNHALMTYFKFPLLDDKLYKSTKLIRQILKSQTFTASEQFEQLFKYVIAAFQNELRFNYKIGDVEYEWVGFDPEGSKTAQQKIGRALDEIIRYKIFAKYAANFFTTKNMSSYNGVFDGPVDFMHNPVEEYKRILYGTTDEYIAEELKYLPKNERTDRNIQKLSGYMKRSLFQNLSLIIQQLRTTNVNERPEYANLVQNGEIINELLNYVYPQTATDKTPVGRLLLSSSQMNVDVEQKRKLRTAFNNLFNHSDIIIRKLARDLAVYAYFSTYDANTPNSFMDLVPPFFRMQYDKTFSYILTPNKDNRNKITEALLGVDGENFDDIFKKNPEIIDSYITMIARNNWTDNTIVPEFYFHTGEDVKSISAYNLYGETRLGETQYLGSSFPVFIITAFTKSPFIKTTRKDKTYLYKKVGTLSRQVNGKKQPGSAAVYKLIPRAGHFLRGQNNFEYTSENSPSLYDENKLPSTIMGRDGNISDIWFEEWYEKNKDSVDNNGNNVNFIFDQQIQQEIPIQFDEADSQNVGSHFFYNDEGTILFQPVKNPRKDLSRTQANMIISLNDLTMKDKVELTRAHGYTDVSVNENPVEVAKRIVDEFDKLPISGSTIHLYVDGILTGIESASQEDISEVTEQMRSVIRDYYKDQNTNELSDQQIEEQVERVIQSKESIIKEEAAKRKLGKFLQQLYLEINKQSDNRLFSRININGESNISSPAALAAANVNKYLNTPGISSLVLFNTKQKVGSNSKTTLENIDAFNNYRSQFNQYHLRYYTDPVDQRTVDEMLNVLNQYEEKIQEQVEQKRKEREERVQEKLKTIQDEDSPVNVSRPSSFNFGGISLSSVDEISLGLDVTPEIINEAENGEDANNKNC